MRAAAGLVFLLLAAAAPAALADSGGEQVATGPRRFGGLGAIRLAQAAHESGPDDSSAGDDGQFPTASVRGTRRWPSPTVTLLKSMLVPGWGQLTNRKYVKAAIAIGLETWFVTGTISNWRQAHDALERYRTTGVEADFLDYQFYWGNRSDFMWALGLTVFVSMFDAYVDAHLRPYAEDTIPGVEPPAGVSVTLLSF